MEIVLNFILWKKNSLNQIKNDSNYVQIETILDFTNNNRLRGDDYKKIRRFIIQNNKEESKEILEEFIDMIKNTTEHIEDADDELSELIISAEDSISKVKHLLNNISKKYDFYKPENQIS